MKRALSLCLAMLLAAILTVPALAYVSASTEEGYASSATKNNMDLAIASLDGLYVESGDTFSFNEIVGPRTTAMGYEKAENGRGVQVIGGGVSQVASALYLALEERGQVRYVHKQVYGSDFTGDYVLSGDDAIVTDYKNDVDFSFRNLGEDFTITLWRSGTSIWCGLDDEGDWGGEDWDDDWDEDYIFPESSYAALTRSDVLSIPRSQWGYARNEIYARHGYVFKTSKYRDYFSDKDWYRPGGFSTSDLSKVEWDNMDLIKRMEAEYESGGSTSGTSGGYLLPQSNRVKLKRSDVLALPQSQWGYARNEIYARHGYEFKTRKYRDYFNKKNWYSPGGFDTSDLNETEWYNMDLIKAMEEEYGLD